MAEDIISHSATGIQTSATSALASVLSDKKVSVLVLAGMPFPYKTQQTPHEADVPFFNLADNTPQTIHINDTTLTYKIASIQYQSGMAHAQIHFFDPHTAQAHHKSVYFLFAPEGQMPIANLAQYQTLLQAHAQCLQNHSLLHIASKRGVNRAGIIAALLASQTSSFAGNNMAMVLAKLRAQKFHQMSNARNSMYVNTAQLNRDLRQMHKALQQCSTRSTQIHSGLFQRRANHPVTEAQQSKLALQFTYRLAEELFAFYPTDIALTFTTRLFQQLAATPNNHNLLDSFTHLVETQIDHNHLLHAAHTHHHTLQPTRLSRPTTEETPQPITLSA